MTPGRTPLVLEAVRFTVTGEPDYPHVCSCTHCLKRAGRPMQSWVGFPFSGLNWTSEGGEPTWYDTFPEKTKRGFCPTCGSHVAALDYGDTTIGINLGALDDQDDPRLVPVNQSCRATRCPGCPRCPTPNTAPSADATVPAGDRT